MTDNETRDREVRPGDVGHPRGTLAIIVIYALLFGLGWMALFFFEFVPRGTPHP